MNNLIYLLPISSAVYLIFAVIVYRFYCALKTDSSYYKRPIKFKERDSAKYLYIGAILAYVLSGIANFWIFMITI